MKNTGKNTSINSVINGHITLKFCTGVAHGKIILQTIANSEIYTDVTDNGVIMSKFENYCGKHLTLKGCISVAGT